MPRERWGWEHSIPEPPRPSPLRDSPPKRRRPKLPDNAPLNPDAAWGVLGAGIAAAVLGTIVLAIAAGSIGFAIGVIGSLIGAGFFGYYQYNQSRQRQQIAAAHRSHDLAYQRAYVEWEEQVREHEERELQRVKNSTIWQERKVESASRVDVFGGTPDSWSNLLATVGSSVLASGSGVLVLDFSEHPVSPDLAKLAALQGFDTATVSLPGAIAQLNLLAGLSPADLSELIAEAAHTARATAVAGDASMKSTDSRSVATEMIESVVTRLQEPITFARLGAGLRLLRRLYSPGRETLLSAAEVREISELVDSLTAGNQASDELQYLSGMLSLVSEESEGAEPVQLWPARGLAVVATESPNVRRKDALDRLVVGRVLHELRAGNARQGDLVVVAGADHLGLPTLESLARQARRRGVRLVLMLEHLRDENAKLLGGSDSAAIIMRLGNAQEATAAADFIGRDYTFVLSQITDSIGKTYTYNTSESEGESESPGQEGPSFSWNDSISESWADSDTKGSTLARVYEYAMEPTTIQALPVTAFLLVDVGPDGRRITACDCFPGIPLLDPHTGQPKPPPRKAIRKDGISSVRSALKAAQRPRLAAPRRDS